MDSGGNFIKDGKERILNLLTKIHEKATPSQASAITQGMFKEWFDLTLVDDFSAAYKASPKKSSPEEARTMLDALMALGQVRESSVVRYGDALLDEDEQQTEHMTSGLFDLDKALGGGFRKGESTLVAAVTGGGKTVFATQFAAHFALHGHKVLFVTTEECPKELIHRMLSNHLNVPCGKFKKGSCNGTVIPSHIQENPSFTEALNDLNARFDNNLKFLDWIGKDKIVNADLNPELDDLAEDTENAFKPDVLIFDWIGGALSKNSKEELRFLYLAAANHLHDLAKRRDRDMCVIMFAQLNKRQATGFRCDSTMLAECKTMPDQATNAIYISSKRTEVGDCNDKEIYEEIQTINVDKARKGPGGCFKVRRDFTFQRFRQFKSSTLQMENASVPNSNNLLGQ
jgi:archaellum biogenesis ATPase FlaH